MKAPSLAQRLRSNSDTAAANRRVFDSARVTTVAVVGPAGSGKTSIIEALLGRLNYKVRAAVIIGGPTADRQISNIQSNGYCAVPLVTARPSASEIREALQELNLDELDLLFIETSGSALSPVEFDLGHHLGVGVFSAAGGQDQLAHNPYCVVGSDLLLLTKTDLPHPASFDLNGFRENVYRLKPGLEVIPTSVPRNEGIDVWLKWVEFHTEFDKSKSSSPRLFRPFTDLYRQ